jgi:hypothetical protein
MANEIVKNSIKSDIITMIYKQGVILDVCKMYCQDRYLLDELVQEVVIIMLGKDNDLVVGLNERGELVRYISQVAKHQFCSSTSPFYKTYKKQQNREREINNEKV